MARAPIEVGIASETKAFRQGVQSGIIDPLEDAADKLDDLGKSKGPEKLEDELEQAQKATKNLGREVDRTADDIERDFRDSYRKAGQSSDDFHDKAAENVENFKSEAIQNLSEVASSFDGDLSDMADGVQGLTGGLAAALTPGIGIPVALLGATAASFLAAWAAAAEDSKQRVSDMYQDMLEQGRAFLSEDYITKSLGDIIDDDGKVAKAREDVKTFGLDIQTILRAQAGDQAAINEVLAAGNEKRQKALDIAQQQGSSAGDLHKHEVLINERWDEALKTYTDVNGEIQKSVDKVRLYQEAVGEAQTADNQRWEELGRKIAGLPSEKVVGLTLDTSEADRQLQSFLNQRNRVVDIRARALDQQGRPIP
jgi:hypothetical protein